MARTIISKGTKFYRGSRRIANIISIDGPSKSRNRIEISKLRDAGYRKYLGSIRDSGTITLSMYFTRENYLLFSQDMDTKEPVEYSIHLPDEEQTILYFKGLVTELPISISTGDAITCQVTIQISGKIKIISPSEFSYSSESSESSSS